MTKEKLEIEIWKYKLKIGNWVSILNEIRGEMIKGLGQLEELNTDLFYPPYLKKRINENKHITKLCDISIRNLRTYKEHLEFIHTVNISGIDWDIAEYTNPKNGDKKGMNNIQCIIYDIEVEYLSTMANINFHLRNKKSDKIRKAKRKKGR